MNNNHEKSKNNNNNNNNNKADDDDDDGKELKKEYEFKWCCLNLGCLSGWASWKFTFVFLCVSCFFENFITTGTATVVLTTLEKEFYLTSRGSGLFLSVYELAAFVASPIVGFLGNRYNKLRLISVSLFVIALGSYLIAVTVFFKPVSESFLLASLINHGNGSLESCAQNRTFRDDCKVIREFNRDSVSGLEYSLYVGHAVIGVGSVAMYVNGIAYIEDITIPEQSSYCQAIFYGVGSIGSGIAILITGQFLNINSRFYTHKLDQVNINTTNPNWIGAWWLPYIIYASILVVLGLIMFGFPPKARNKLKKCAKKTSDNEENQQARKNLSFGKRFSLSVYEFLIQLKLLFKNYKLVAIIISSATEGILLKGFLGFISKYFESQFELSAANSTLITGSIALVSILVGTLSSAYLINRYKWKGYECTLFCFMIYLLTSFCFWILLNYCPNQILERDFAYCSKCNCENRFNPVCYKTNESKIFVYQSACHAGCTTFDQSTNAFMNCFCSSDVPQVSLSTAYCDRNVKCVLSLVLNVAAAFVIVLMTAVTLIPHLKSILFCIQEKEQPFTLGINAAVNRLVGNFIGSIIVGQAIDLTCNYWLENCYGQKNCKVYDNAKMSLSLAIIGFACRFLTALFNLIACVFFYRERKNQSTIDKYSTDIDQTNQVTRF